MTKIGTLPLFTKTIQQNAHFAQRKTYKKSAFYLLLSNSFRIFANANGIVTEGHVTEGQTLCVAGGKNNENNKYDYKAISTDGADPAGGRMEQRVW